MALPQRPAGVDLRGIRVHSFQTLLAPVSVRQELPVQVSRRILIAAPSTITYLPGAGVSLVEISTAVKCEDCAQTPNDDNSMAPTAQLSSAATNVKMSNPFSRPSIWPAWPRVSQKIGT